MNQPSEISAMHIAAQEWADAGCSVVPPRMDGSKAPAANWKTYQTVQPTQDEIAQWYGRNQDGVGIVTGAISGNLEMVELEGRAVAENFHIRAREIANAGDLGELLNTVVYGYMESTPSGGLHLLYRISDHEVPGNTKIARRPGSNGGVDVLVETRGEGGYVIVAPSGGSVHPSGGAWTTTTGCPATIPTITWQERNALFDIFRSLDEMPSAQVVAEAMATAPKGEGVSPGDDFNQRATWQELLIPAGWVEVYKAGSITYWRRPGKTTGISATTGRNDGDNLFVFSSSVAHLEQEKPYSKWAYFTSVNYGGDFKLSAMALRQQGYGSISAVPELKSNGLIDYGSGDTSYIEVSESHSPGAGNGDEVALPKSRAQVLLENELEMGRARREAKSYLDGEDAVKRYDRLSYTETLAEELLQPIEEVEWLIQDIFPSNANVTLTAQYKAGKTTLINHLAKALVDGEPFLNFFKATPSAVESGERVVIFNYEVSKSQYLRWLSESGIKNADWITVVHLRGKNVPLKSDHVRSEVVEHLRRLGTSTWIVDPFARAFTGSGDENSNSDVSVFLEYLDQIKDRAGIKNLIMPIHTGRAQESGIDRARGATRLDDWPDVRWILKKTDDGRFFSADGRDVQLDEMQLRYDPMTRSLTLGGRNAHQARVIGMEELWISAVARNEGRTTSEICQFLERGVKDKALSGARKMAEIHKKVKKTSLGSADLWWLFDTLTPQQISSESA